MEEFIKNYLPVIVTVIVWFLILRTGNSITQIYKHITDINKRTAHLYTLTKILSDGLCSPIHKQIYTKALLRGSDNMPKNPAEDFELFKEIIQENYTRMKNALIKLKDSINDPMQIRKCEAQITELGNVIILLDTIDEKTSKEHVGRIMYEINMTLLNLDKV